MAGREAVFDGLAPDLELDGVVHVARARHVAGLWRARRVLAPLVAEADPVHAHGLKAGWVAALSARAAVGRGGPVRRAPVVLTVHNVVLAETAGRAAPALRRLQRALVGRVDAVIATSPAVAAHLGMPAAHVVVPFADVPTPTFPPADVRRDLGVGAHQPLVVAVGRLHPQKGFATLVRAARLLVEDLPDVAVVIVGEGPEEAQLRRVVADGGLQDVVHLVGPRYPAVDQLAAADVVVIPSLWESGPLVALEALTLGRPLVATPVGFVPDLVVDDGSVRLVPVGEASALASAVADVLSAGGPVGLDGAGRRRLAERLDPDRLVDAVEDVYAAALAARSAPSRP